MPATAPDGRTLIGSIVRLDPSIDSDAAELFAALDDERVYAAQYGGGPAGRPRTPADTLRWITDARADPSRLMFTVRLVADCELGAAGIVVGTSSLGDAVPAHERIHLGWTGYAPAVWGTGVNPECKLLMLQHAFEDCGFGRVKIQTDLVNTRSQAAIAKLGAVREGVLRRHQLRGDGSHRDTVVYSVLSDEWPEVRAGLLRRLGRGR